MCLPDGGSSRSYQLTFSNHEHRREDLASSESELNYSKMNSEIKPGRWFIVCLFNLNFSSHLLPRSIQSNFNTRHTRLLEVEPGSPRVELHEEDTFKAWI